MNGSIKLSPETQDALRKAREKRNAKTMDETIADIRRERKEREKRLVQRLSQEPFSWKTLFGR